MRLQRIERLQRPQLFYGFLIYTTKQKRIPHMDADERVFSVSHARGLGDFMVHADASNTLGCGHIRARDEHKRLLVF